MTEDAEKATAMSLGDRLARLLFFFSCAMALFGFGVAVGVFHIFPYALLKSAFLQATHRGPSYHFYFPMADANGDVVRRRAGFTDAGVNLVTQIDANEALTAKVVDMDGRVLHTWDLDFFRIWPDVSHVSGHRKPRNRPGTSIHGAVVMENGDLIFNYEHVGLVRVDRSGDAVWRLPYQTHHSIHIAEDGNLWVSGQIEHRRPLDRFPTRAPPFDEYVLLEVSPAGEVLHTWSVPGLLKKNGLAGLLYDKGKETNDFLERPDALHLNDVEPFPASMKEGVFKHGDVLVSLRNISTVFVFNRHTGKIKHASIGRFVWQHDPDFIDGDRYSVFDNATDSDHSKIVIVSAKDDTITVHFEGTEAQPFYTGIMGKHQWLPGGHVLVTEPWGGRGFQIDGRGRILWEYFNDIGDGRRGLVTEVTRLSPSIARLFAEPGPPGNTGASSESED